MELDIYDMMLDNDEMWVVYESGAAMLVSYAYVADKDFMDLDN